MHVSDTLARVHWELGQTLLPEHFISQEESYLRDTALRFTFSGRPYYGVAGVKWNETLVTTNSVFVLSEFSYLFPSGLLIVLGENAVLGPELDNKVVFPPPEDKTVGNIDVYVHVLQIKHETEPVKFTKEVKKNIYKLVITTEDKDVSVIPPYNDGHYKYMDSCKLAEFTRSRRNVWIIDSSYVPPLLQVGTSPFLRDSLHDIEKILQHKANSLKKIFEKNMEKGTDKKSSAYLLSRFYTVLRLIHNIQTEVHIHPYDLIAELQQLCSEIMLFHSNKIYNSFLLYNHKKIADCFWEIHRLISNTGVDDDEYYYIIPFQLVNGIYSVDIPEDPYPYLSAYIIKAKEKGVSMEQEQKLPDFSCRQKLVNLCAPVITGLELHEEHNPEITEQFPVAINCYKVEDNEEWKEVVAEKNVGYLAQTYLIGYQFYLVLERGN